MKQSSRLLLISSALLLVLLNVFLDTFSPPPLLHEQSRHLLVVASEEIVPDGHYLTLALEDQSVHLPIDLNGEYVSFPCRGCTHCIDDDDSALANLYVPPEEYHQCPDACAFPESVCEDNHTGCRVTIEGELKGYETSTQQASIEKNGTTIEEEFPLNFVCEDEIASHHPHEVSGSLGMADTPHSFLNQLFDTGKIPEKVFSMHFHPISGQFVLGPHPYVAAPDSHPGPPFIWAKRSPLSPKYYTLHMRRVYLGMGGGLDPLVAEAEETMSLRPIGTDGDETKRPVLFQTRDAVTFLHESIQAEFVGAFQELTNFNFDVKGFGITKEQFEALPTVFLQFEAALEDQGEWIQPRNEIPGMVGGRYDPDHPYDLLLAVPPKHYITMDEDGVAYPKISFSNSPSLGSNVLHNHEVIFDVGRGRIGFAERRYPPDVAPDGTNNAGRMGGGEQIETMPPTGGVAGRGIEKSYDDDDDVVETGNSTSAPGRSVADEPEGLPEPAFNSKPRKLHIGPGAVAAEVRDMITPDRSSYTWWHLVGFSLFLFGFFSTILATSDPNETSFSRITKKYDRKKRRKSKPVRRSSSILYPRPAKRKSWFNRGETPIEESPSLEEADEESFAADVLLSKDGQEEEERPMKSRPARRLSSIFLPKAAKPKPWFDKEEDSIEKPPSLEEETEPGSFAGDDSAIPHGGYVIMDDEHTVAESTVYFEGQSVGEHDQSYSSMETGTVDQIGSAPPLSPTRFIKPVRRPADERSVRTTATSRTAATTRTVSTEASYSMHSAATRRTHGGASNDFDSSDGELRVYAIIDDDVETFYGDDSES